MTPNLERSRGGILVPSWVNDPPTIIVPRRRPLRVPARVPFARRWAAPVQVSTVSFTDGGASAGASLAGVTAGNLLVLVIIGAQQSSTTALSAPTNYFIAESPVGTHISGNGYDPIAAIFYRENAPSGAHAPTVSCASGSYMMALLFEYPITGTGTLDKTTSAGSGGAAVTSHSTGNTATTTQANETIVAGIAVDCGNVGVLSAAAGYNSRALSADNSVHCCGEIVDKAVSSTGAQSAAWNFTGSGLAATAAIATFKDTGGGGGGGSGKPSFHYAQQRRR